MEPPFTNRPLRSVSSLNYREWSGYYAVSVYETHHEHEYNAIRNAAALIDVTPLFKYIISGRDATRFVNRVIARDINKVGVNQVIYCCWCDEDGKVIDDGTITAWKRTAIAGRRRTRTLRWLRQNAIGYRGRDRGRLPGQVAALALQGPTSGALLKSVAEADIENLKYFRKTSGKDRRCRGGHFAHRLHRRSGLRDLDSLGRRGEGLGDALMDGGRGFDIHPAGMLALERRTHRSRTDPGRRGLHQ